MSDIECGSVLFFRTRAPVEPVSFVHKICSDALKPTNTQKHRWARRLTPMTLMGKATEKGLETVAKAVLGPAFHDGEKSPKKVFNPILAFLCHSSLNFSVIWGSNGLVGFSSQKIIIQRAFGAYIRTDF